MPNSQPTTPATQPTAPASRVSYTSTASFEARQLEAEQWRLSLLIATYAVLIATWIARREMGGFVAATNLVFFPAISTLAAAIGINASALIHVRRVRARGTSMPNWYWLVGAWFDLAVAFVLLIILQLFSPAGPLETISAPSLLLVPLSMMLSALRLRPRLSLALAVAAGAGHWALTFRATALEGTDSAHFPKYLGYGILLLSTGIAASALAHLMRRMIRDAVREAEAAERSARSLGLIERELDIARTIQEGLLPKTAPAIHNYQVAAFARPAAQTGGDFYDWQMLPDGRCVFAIADVTGHGIGPALVMAVCRAYSRAVAPGANGASDVLERINHLITADMSDSRFITMAIALASPDGRVDLLSAGHGPTFLYKARSAQIERFDSDGVPLGVIEDEQYRPIRHLALEPGDTLVMLTDGFMERRSPTGELFGIPRLSAAIARHATADAQTLLRAIDDETSRFAASSPQDDDMTAVVLRYV